MLGMAVKRFITMVTAAAAFLTAAAVPAAGEPADISAVSYYCKGGVLHSFIYMESREKAAEARAALLVDYIETASNVVPEPVRESKAPVRYILLIDLSTSMPDYRQQIADLADSLSKNGGGNAVFDVQGFGERFEIVKENIRSGDELHRVISELHFDHCATDIGGGVLSAVTHLGERQRNAGEADELIVITDGVPYIGTGGDESKAVKKSAKRVTNRLADRRELIVHTLTVGSDTPDPDMMAALNTGRGLSLSLKPGGNAAECAGKITAFTDDLYLLSLPLAWDKNAERMQVQMVLTDGLGEVLRLMTLSGIRDVDKPDTLITPDDSSAAPIVPLIPEGGGSVSEAPDEPASPADILPKDDSSETEEESSAAEPAEPAVTETGSSSEAEQPPAPLESAILPEPPGEPLAERTNPLIWIIPCASVVIAAAVVIIVLKKNKPSPAKAEKTDPLKEETGGIFIRMEVAAGVCLSRQREFRLNDALKIGSSGGCDIVLGQGDASPVNTRIYFADNMIMIEDLNRESNTSISGMRIHAPNRLRSGDEVTVGTVRMIFRF